VHQPYPSPMQHGAALQRHGQRQHDHQPFHFTPRVAFVYSGPVPPWPLRLGNLASVLARVAGCKI
jgi:hypothetical protein